jgi:hypothetical protein
MSSEFKLTDSLRRALTCQAINPAEKTTATAAAIHAFVVDFKILSFPELKTIAAALTRAARHSLMRGE